MDNRRNFKFPGIIGTIDVTSSFLELKRKRQDFKSPGIKETIDVTLSFMELKEQ